MRGPCRRGRYPEQADARINAASNVQKKAKKSSATMTTLMRSTPQTFRSRRRLIFSARLFFGASFGSRDRHHSACGTSSSSPTPPVLMSTDTSSMFLRQSYVVSSTYWRCWWTQLWGGFVPVVRWQTDIDIDNTGYARHFCRSIIVQLVNRGFPNPFPAINESCFSARDYQFCSRSVTVHLTSHSYLRGGS